MLWYDADGIGGGSGSVHVATLQNFNATWGDFQMSDFTIIG
jgi:hypothetical protein